jgi:hypothetical protein
MSTSSSHARILKRYGAAFVTAMLVAIIGPAGCGGPSSERCRFEPESCPGKAGALCEDDYDCRGGLHCCTDDANCGGGMCTFDCDDDYDCPHDMLCQHDMCFYACESDADCAPEMSCEHDAVCEYQ